MSLGMDLLAFILFEVCRVSWTHRLMFFTKFRELFATVSCIFSAPLSHLPLSGTPIVCMFMPLMVCHIFLRFHLFFLCSFFPVSFKLHNIYWSMFKILSSASSSLLWCLSVVVLFNSRISIWFLFIILFIDSLYLMRHCHHHSFTEAWFHFLKDIFPRAALKSLLLNLTAVKSDIWAFLPTASVAPFFCVSGSFVCPLCETRHFRSRGSSAYWFPSPVSEALCCCLRIYWFPDLVGLF